jgi:hypothetical protein
MVNKFKQIKNKHGERAKIVKPNLKHPKSRKEIEKEIKEIKNDLFNQKQEEI